MSTLANPFVRSAAALGLGWAAAAITPRDAGAALISFQAENFDTMALGPAATTPTGWDITGVQAPQVVTGGHIDQAVSAAHQGRSTSLSFFFNLSAGANLVELYVKNAANMSIGALDSDRNVTGVQVVQAGTGYTKVTVGDGTPASQIYGLQMSIIVPRGQEGQDIFADTFTLYREDGVTSVAEPGSVALLGAGLLGLAAVRRRRGGAPALAA